jgi:hypothetical protein
MLQFSVLIKTQPTVPVPSDFNLASYSALRCGVSVENDPKPFSLAKFVLHSRALCRRIALIFGRLELILYCG